MKRTMIDNSVS